MLNEKFVCLHQEHGNALPYTDSFSCVSANACPSPQLEKYFGHTHFYQKCSHLPSFEYSAFIHYDDICSQRKRPKTNLEGEHWKQTLGNYILIQIEELKLKDYKSVSNYSNFCVKISLKRTRLDECSTPKLR